MGYCRKHGHPTSSPLSTVTQPDDLSGYQLLFCLLTYMVLSISKAFSHKDRDIQINKASEKGQRFLNVCLHWQKVGKAFLLRLQTEINEQM